MKKSLINLLALIFISSIPFAQTVEGIWKMSPVAGALGVGPAVGDVSWWANSEGDVTTRACFFDDQYVFNANGSFKNVLGAETWNEAWQTGVDADGCGAPVAPHDGSNAATWSVDETAKTITVVGSGAFLGLAKAHNTAEDGAPVNMTTVYNYTLSSNGKSMDVNIEVGTGVFWQYKFSKVLPAEVLGTWKMSPVAGALGVGPAVGDVSWWANSEDDVTTRACFFDDQYVFYANGSFKNVLGAETWNEAWQTGVDADGCGAPVAPHDGANAATWSVDEDAKTITVVGSGAYLGLAKAHNTAEDGLPVDNTIVYNYTLSSDGKSMDVNIEVGTGVFWQYKFSKVVPEKIEGAWRLAPEAGAMGVGPAVGDYSYWSSSLDDVTARACIFDDQYVFNADGSYQNVLGAETWLETYKLSSGQEAGCGAPIAPHDGSNAATWSVDETAGTITVVGEGAYLGLFKVTNTDGGDGDYVPAVDNTIVYNYTLSDGGNKMDVIIEPAAGLVWNFKLVKSDPSKFAGSWSMSSEAGALGVGPAVGDVSWWANSEGDVTTRACFFDDEYVFSANGSFSNVFGSTTWLEAWQTGVDADGCGAPVAPHNGLSAATWSVDETAGTVTIVGSGAFLGLSKAHNTAEDGAPVDNTTTYNYAFSADGNSLAVNIEVGTGVFWQYKFTRNGAPPTVVTSPLEATTWLLRPKAGALAVGDGAGATWWASSGDDVTGRACLFDDEYVFNADGSFQNVLGEQTWLEAWQTGVDADGCGAPIAPHDGSSAATWSADETAGTITLVGSGAYLGLSKVHNTAEDGAPVNNTITYNYTLTADTNRLDISIAGFNVDVPAAAWEYEFVRKGSDFTAPAQAEDVVAFAGEYSNAVTWVDVPAETGETYSVYASRKPFADTSPAALVGNVDVDLVAADVAEDIGSAEHALTIPLSDRWASYYYAVVCTDAVGNVGLVSATEGAVNNKVRGIPVVSLSPPVSFAADGDISEWEASGIIPLEMGVSTNSMGIPKVIGTVDDDADASVKLYLAADDTVLYMAADITDNYFHVRDGNWWEQDALELFIGLFDKRGARESGFSRGASPHYKLVFKGDTAWTEMVNGALGKSGDGNYFHSGVVGSPDAIIEFKVRFDALAAIDGDSLFKPVKGMRIPIEPVWHDNDGAGAWEGNIVMSKNNNDNAWQTPATWSHTFIGNQDGDILSTEDNLIATTFSLKENYPNPFNPTTTIEYSIGIAGPTKLMVYDVLGREVVKLVDEYRPIGSHKVVLNASNMPSGIYFYRLETSSFTRTQKMILMK